VGADNAIFIKTTGLNVMIRGERFLMKLALVVVVLSVFESYFRWLWPGVMAWMDRVVGER
jgi:hypothetical protein